VITFKSIGQLVRSAESAAAVRIPASIGARALHLRAEPLEICDATQDEALCLVSLAPAWLVIGWIASDGAALF
jgi:hypothetical protein